MERRFATILLACLAAPAPAFAPVPVYRGGPAGDTKPTPSIKMPPGVFRLDLPALATRIKQGETRDLKIRIAKGEGFDLDVALSYKGLPRGVTIGRATIFEGEYSVVVKVRVGENTRPGAASITVVATPTKGVRAESTLELLIVKKD